MVDKISSESKSPPPETDRSELSHANRLGNHVFNEIFDHSKMLSAQRQANSGRNGEDGNAERQSETPAMNPNSELTPQEKAVKHDVNAFVNEQVKNGFSGNVLIAKDGKVVLSRSEGMQDRDTGTPVTDETKFRIASMGKMFTSTAIMQLVQNHKLSLDDKLSKFLPIYPNKEFADNVTIHQLLTHTAGAGEVWGPEFNKNREQLKNIDDYIKLFGKRDGEFKPGSEFKYSNYGYILLGAVVEKASGMSYDDYLKQNIFKPAGMNSTGAEPENVTVANRAKGYTSVGGTITDAKDTYPYRGTPAGGSYSTASDILKFAEALQGNRLLDAKHRELLTTGKVQSDMGWYAYGFFDGTKPDGPGTYGHAGGSEGMSGDLRIDPKNGWIMIALFNRDDPAAPDITAYAAERIRRK